MTTHNFDIKDINDMNGNIDIDDCSDDLIRRSGRGDTPFGLYVLSPSDPAAELARSIEREVFYQFYGNTPGLLAEEYGRYEAASVYLCVVDHLRRRPAGMIRVITPSEAGTDEGPGSKSLDDIERIWGRSGAELASTSGIDLVPSTTLDIATLAVAHDYRGAATSGLVSLALYQAVTMLMTNNDMRWMLAVLDLVVLDIIQKTTARPFSPFPGLEPKNYLDSPASLPVYSDLPAYRQRLAVAEPAMHEILFEGRGIEAAVSTPVWDGRLYGQGLAAVG